MITEHTDYGKIQKEVIARYRVNIHSDGCMMGLRRRMHAHIKERTVCKWSPKATMRATFDLLHEIGHIETTTGDMRRCEAEYHATIWAIDRCMEYGIDIPEKIIYIYQRYIEVERSRGTRRHGKGYEELNLYRYMGKDIDLEMVRDLARTEGWLI